MHIGVLGINQKSGPFGLREKIAKASATGFLRERVHALSLVALNTCSRTELYFSAENLAVAHSALLNALQEEIDEPFEHALYTYFGVECFSHLAKVTAGLDSTILFETEIQRQVKVAYTTAACERTLHPAIHFLFQKCLKLGKEVRRELPPPVKTFPALIGEIVLHLLGSWQDLRVLLVGNSEINRQMITWLKERKVGPLSVCTRSPHAVEDGALDVRPWEALSTWSDFDVVITGTNSATHLISSAPEGMRTKVLFDLGVPRNVAPWLGKHPQLVLFNVEALGQILEKKQHEQKERAMRAERVLEEKTAYYAIRNRRSRESAEREWHRECSPVPS